MARRELEFQKELATSTKKQGGFAEIISQRFLAGFPDTILKMPEFPYPMFVECKYYEKSSKARTADVPVELTELQRNKLKKMREAGLTVAVLIKVTIDGKEPRVYTVGNLDATHFSLADHCEAPLHREKVKDKYMDIWDMEKLGYNIAEAEIEYTE